MVSETFKFSIIVPVYNEDKTILKVIENLNNLKKYYQNIQIIVINDGSRDNSLKILENNKSLIDVLINNPNNKGKGNAVKKGIQVAEGDYITFQDADLEYDPNDFKKFLKLINMTDLTFKKSFITNKIIKFDQGNKILKLQIKKDLKKL